MNQKKRASRRTATKNPVGRPPRPMPDLIPDTPENVARAILAGPPKKKWRYLEKSDS